MYRIVFPVILACFVVFVNKSQCKMTEEERKTHDALLEIWKTAMNRSLVPENEVEDFLDANGVTEEIVEKALDAISEDKKEEIGNRLKSVDEDLVNCVKSNQETEKKLDELAMKMNDFDIETQKDTDSLRKKIMGSKRSLDATRQLSNVLSGPIRNLLETETDKVEKQLAESSARLTDTVEQYESGMVKFRAQLEQLRSAHGKSKEWCEHLNQLASDLRMILAEWPGEMASFVDKALNIMKYDYLMKHHIEYTKNNLKAQKEFLRDGGHEQPVQIDDTVVSEKDEL